jgi:hypothetical protein
VIEGRRTRYKSSQGERSRSRQQDAAGNPLSDIRETIALKILEEEGEATPLLAALAEKANGSGHEAATGNKGNSNTNQNPERQVDVHLVLFSFAHPCQIHRRSGDSDRWSRSHGPNSLLA